MKWEDILKRTYGRLDETGYSPYNEERSLRTESPPEEESGDDTQDIVDDPEEWIRQQEQIPSEKNTSKDEEWGLYLYANNAAEADPLSIVRRIEKLAKKVVSGNHEKRLKEVGKTMKGFVDEQVSVINGQLRQLDTLEPNTLGFKWYDEMYRTQYIPNRKKLREALKRLDSIKDMVR